MYRLIVRGLFLAILWLSGPGLVVHAQQPVEPTVNGKPLRHWLTALNAKDVSRRIEAAEALAQFGSAAKPAVPGLIQAMSDPEEWVRRQAVFALQTLGSDAQPAIPALRKALEDPSSRVRLLAAQTLSRLDQETTAGAPVLAAIFTNGSVDLALRYQAGQALQELGPRAAEGLTGLGATLRDPDGSVVSTAGSILGSVGADGLPPLVAALKQRDDANRHQIVSALSTAISSAADLEHQRPGAPTFGELRTDAEKAEAERIRKEHAVALRLWQSRMQRNQQLVAAALPDLVAFLGDRDETVRNTVASVLPRLGPRLGPELTRALQAPDARQRLLAAQLLGRADPRTTAPIAVLAAVLKDRQHDYPLRLLAVQTLAEFGHRSREALPLLLDTTAETQGELAAHASAALNCCLPDDLPWLLKNLRSRPPIVRPYVAAGIHNAIANLGGPPEVGSNPIFPDRSSEAQPPTAAERARLERVAKHQALIRKVLPDLLAALDDPNDTVRSHLTSALCTAGPLAVPALLQALEGKGPRVRLGAVQALAGMSMSEGERVRVRHALARWKEDADAPVRAAIAQLLTVAQAAPRPPVVAQTLEGLKEQLESKQESVRNAAIFPLAAKREQALPVLRPLLKHPDAVVRLAALAVIANMGPRPREAIAELLLVLEDADSNVRLQAVGLLSGFGADASPAVPALARLLEDAQPQVRATAAQTLCNVGAAAKPALMALVRALQDDACRDLAINALVNLGPEAAAALRPLITERDSPKRALGLVVLARLGANARPALPELLTLLHDRRHSLRVQAGNVLANLGPLPEVALPALLAALDDDDDVRQRAVQLLAGMGEDVVAPLCKALKGADGRLLPDALPVLQALGGRAKGAVPDLIVLLQNSKNVRLRLQVLQVLAAMGVEAAPAALALADALEKAPEVDVRQWSFQVLQQLGPADGKARPTLERLLRSSPDAGRRQQAAMLLGRLGTAGRAALPTLVAALEKDPDLTVRQYAIQSIGQLGLETKDAVPVLLRALEQDTDINVRSQAAQTLGQLGASGREAVPTLIRLLKHPSADTRLFAASSLAYMGREARPALQPILALLPDAEANYYENLLNILPRLGAAEELALALTADSARVREAAARSLAQMGPEAKPAAPRLAGALRDPSPVVRLAALQVVVNLRLDAREALPAVFANLDDADETIGQTALAAVVALAPDSIAPAGEALRWNQPRLRSRALGALAQLGEPVKEVLPALLAVAASPEVGVRVQALQLVNVLPWPEGDPRVRARVEASLQDPDPQVRAVAAPLVARFGPEAVHFWVGLMSHPAAEARRGAAVALAGFPHTRAALPVLAAALKDADPRVRTQAAITLWQIDQQRQTTVSVLIEAAKDADASVRHEAMKGLISMEGFPLLQPRSSFG